MAKDVAKRLVSKEVREPHPRSSFLLHSVVRRIPGYAFFIIHLCFIHVVWGALVDQFSTATLSFMDGNITARELVTSASMEFAAGFRETVRETLVYGLSDVLRSRGGYAKMGVVKLVRVCLMYLWGSPSSMVFFFGLVFIAVNATLALLRLVTASLNCVISPCWSQHTLQRGGSRRPVPLHIIARYGNGYDSVVRFFLAGLEFTWFMSYPVLSSAAALRVMMGKAATSDGKSEPTYASLKQLQARQQSIASFQVEASLMLPPQLFDSTADALAAGWTVILVVKIVLGTVLAIDAQRLFHAFVGVRPLVIPNGWERCPVCGMLWKKSRASQDDVHACPIILVNPPVPASAAASMTSSSFGGNDPASRPVLGAAVRPGDGFPDPNEASLWERVTDSWLSPLMNFTLMAPFGTFSPPPISSIGDDGRGHWQALLRVVDRLPRMPFDLNSREEVSEPVWRLWRQRNDPVAANAISAAMSPMERSFMVTTAPLRRMLGRAFAVFFLPPPPPVVDPATLPPGATLPKRNRGATLFRVFLRHPSGREFVYMCVPLKITQDLLSLVAPGVIKSLVSFLKEVSVANSNVRQGYLGRGLLICLYLILAVALQVLFFQAYLSHLYVASLKASSALKALLLRQSLETPLAYAGGAPLPQQAVAAAAVSPTQSSLAGSSKEDRKKKDMNATPAGKATPPRPATASALSRDGEITSLLTVDTTNCADCVIFLHNVWGHPFVIVSSLMSMYTYVGLFSTLVTFAALVALIPFNRSSAARVRTAQQHAKNNESRLSDLTAAMSAMRTVKSMALEECLVERVVEARARESEGMKRVGKAESVAAAQTEVTTLLVALVCCGSYLITGGTMDASVLVPTMAALQVMRFPVWTLPHLYSQVSRGYTSLLRIERYLLERDAGDAADAAYVAHQVELARKAEPAEGNKKMSAPAPLPVVKVGEVRCVCSTFAWNTQKALAERISRMEAAGRSPRGPASPVALTPVPSSSAVALDTTDGAAATTESAEASFGASTSSLSLRTSVDGVVPTTSRAVVLQNISLHVSPGEFVVIQGPTGCGKSALLYAMLRELYVMPKEAATSSSSPFATTIVHSGDNNGFRVGGRVAYCAEVPWLRQGTVRENIRLLSDEAPESAKERKWYRKVLEACALQSDLDVLAKGDRTMVGEGGSKLSGGQRARVAVARAVYRYRETDVFLFDDVLSALDVEVQKHIIANLFHGLLCGSAGTGTASASSSTAASPNSNSRPRRTKTVIFVTHVSPSLLQPDRVSYLWGDGTLHEDNAYVTPTAEQIQAQKAQWRSATVAATEAKDNRRSRQTTTNVESPLSPRPDASSPVVAVSRHASRTATASAQAGISVLLPRWRDLQRLFLDYIGGRRLVIFFVLSVSMQIFRTLMDNWLGVYISLYDKRKAAYETILRSTKSQRARKFMLDLLSLVVLRADKVAPTAAPTLPPQPLFTLLGYPVTWSNPFTLDTVASQFLGTYAVIGLSSALLSMIRTDFFFRSYQRMTDALQLHAVRKLFLAPVSYFDRVPSSRLLQVLSRDQEVVDRSLGESVQLIFLTILQLLGMVLFNTLHYHAFILVLPVSVLLFYHLTVRFLSFTKQVRSLEGVLQSRSLSVVKDAVKGAITIRAFGDVFQNQLLGEMDEALDAVHIAASAGLTADRWVALRLEFVSLAFTSSLSILSVLTVCLSATTSAGSAAFAGLGIISSMTAARSLSMLCRRFGMFQNQYVSAEQLLRLEEEITVEGAEDKSDSKDSSSSNSSDSEAGEASTANGEAVESQVLTTKSASAYPLLDVRHLCGKYQDHLPWVLSDICFALQPGECVGLIGRTGNGKSSLFNALLGLMDVIEGEVLVPDSLINAVPQASAAQQPAKQVNAVRLPQHELRKHFFELVSQEPLLLQGTCRSNLLLGYEQAGDTAESAVELESRLLEVLHKVSLPELLVPSLAAASAETAEAGGEAVSAAAASGVTPDSAAAPVSGGVADPLVDPAAYTLDHLVTAGGANFSAGQRQLLCLARAILHHPRVVLLDEVSSRVDRHTDELIQQVIKEEMLHRRGGSRAPATAAEKAASSGVLLIAHRLETIIALCDRVLVIEQGRCVANLSKEQVSGLDDLESYL